MFSVKNLSISRMGKVVLESASFELSPGMLLDLNGESGVGKSSILWALAGLIPASGEITLDGKACSDGLSPSLWRTMVALVPQKPVMCPGTVMENLLLSWSFKVKAAALAPGGTRLREELDSVGLVDVPMDWPAENLSVGQMARVAFLRVFISSPRVLLLDEVSANLDSFSAGLLDDKITTFLKNGNYVVRVRHHKSGIDGHSLLTISKGGLV